MSPRGLRVGDKRHRGIALRGPRGGREPRGPGVGRWMVLRHRALMFKRVRVGPKRTTPRGLECGASGHDASRSGGKGGALGKGASRSKVRASWYGASKSSGVGRRPRGIEPQGLMSGGVVIEAQRLEVLGVGRRLRAMVPRGPGGGRALGNGTSRYEGVTGLQGTAPQGSGS